MVYNDLLTLLSDHKESVERHVRNILRFMLPIVVEYEILRFQIVADNNEHHIEYVL